PLPKLNGKKLFGKVFELRCRQAAIPIPQREFGEFMKNERWRNAAPDERYLYELYAKAVNEENEQMFMTTYDINEPINVNINVGEENNSSNIG
ncbi:34836_t:CDS:1, partial [Racocetra persica]